jgi:hypothetical protein
MPERQPENYGEPLAVPADGFRISNAAFIGPGQAAFPKRSACAGIKHPYAVVAEHHLQIPLKPIRYVCQAFFTHFLKIFLFAR